MTSDNTAAENGEPFSTKLKRIARLTATVVVLMVSGAVLWDVTKPRLTRSAQPQPVLPTEPISIVGVPLLGTTTAKVGLVLFSEFECPYCAKAARDVMPQINQQYVQPGHVVIAWRHYPLSFHKNAQPTAEAAVCAGLQGRFWGFHDWAFENQKELGRLGVHTGAKHLGLDLKQFDVCRDGQASATVAADVALGTSLDVKGTPTWFVGTLEGGDSVKVTAKIYGAKPFKEFQRVIDAVLGSAERLAK